MTEDEDGQQILRSQFTKRGYMLHKSINQETVEIIFDNYTHLNENSLKVAQNMKKNVVSDVMQQLKQDSKALIIQYSSTRSGWIQMYGKMIMLVAGIC